MHAAVRLMYAGLAATVAALVLTAVALNLYAKAAQVAKGHFRLAAEAYQNSMQGAAAVGTVADLLGVVCWVVLATAARRGRGWTRTAGTVLFGIYTLVLLTVLLRTHNDPGARFMTLAAWALGLAAIILLSSREARAFFATWRRH